MLTSIKFQRRIVVNTSLRVKYNKTFTVCKDLQGVQVCKVIVNLSVHVVVLISLFLESHSCFEGIHSL